jgi:hypothetical protein
MVHTAPRSCRQNASTNDEITSRDEVYWRCPPGVHQSLMGLSGPKPLLTNSRRSSSEHLSHQIFKADKRSVLS